MQLPTPRFWGAFEDLFPVTLHGKPPPKAQAAEAGFEDRSYYHYWRRLQYRLRVKYTLGKCLQQCQSPYSLQFVRCVWLKTHQRPFPQRSPLTGLAKNPQRIVSSVPLPRRPRGSTMCQPWRVCCWHGCPARNRPLWQMTLSSFASVIHQKWKGLAIKHFEGKGKGMTTHICNCLEEQGEGSCLLKSMFIYLCAGGHCHHEV